MKAGNIMQSLFGTGTKEDAITINATMSIEQKDKFYAYQTAGRLPPILALSADSIHRSGIIDRHEGSARSEKVFNRLQKIDVIDSTGLVNTSAIGRGFTNELNSVPSYQQKQIVDLLFWWEEECHRLRKLEEERQELTGMLSMNQEGNPDRTMIEALLARVIKKTRCLPSQRDQALERDEDELMMRFRESTAVPPRYE